MLSELLVRTSAGQEQRTLLCTALHCYQVTFSYFRGKLVEGKFVSLQYNIKLAEAGSEVVLVLGILSTWYPDSGILNRPDAEESLKPPPKRASPLCRSSLIKEELITSSASVQHYTCTNTGPLRIPSTSTTSLPERKVTLRDPADFKRSCKQSFNPHREER